jgi:tetratricopeptide (TPR) repeat protein
VDVTNPPPDLRFPETSGRAARRYLSVRNQPLYKSRDAPSGGKDAKADKAAIRALARLPWARVESDEKDAGPSEAALRRTVDSGAAVDPVWNRLVAMLIRAKRFDDLQSLARATLEREDSARARLALAKALEGLDRVEEAWTLVKEAFARQPDDPYAIMASAVLAMKKEDEDAAVREKLQKAQAAVAKTRSREASNEFLVVMALHMSLTGNEDAALQVLETVLALDPGHEEAKRLFEVLE